MDFSAGDVMRLTFKWPHRKGHDDGHKDRACVVFQVAGQGFFAAPMSTVKPDKQSAPYAVPVPAAMQRQLGLSHDKPSWIYADHANMVEPPNPSIQPARRGDNGQMRWTYGKMPAGILSQMRQKRDAAIAAKALKIESIKPDDTIEKYRARVIQRAGRLTPGDPDNAMMRRDEIQAKAAERANRDAEQKRATLSVQPKAKANSR
jgi:hypothetical protein